MNTCTIAGRCSGCPQIQWPMERQISEKLSGLQRRLGLAGLTGFGEIEILSAGDFRLRDRVDLTLMNSQIGLFELGNSGVIDMKECPMMSPGLEDWFKIFRATLPPQIKKGSVRLRVSPSGRRGVWLDFSNVDVRDLLEEKTWLTAVMKEAVVEIGQKRKILSVKEGQLKLSDPRAEPWFETYLPKPTSLFCNIGSFTQVGFAANRLLVGTVMKSVDECGRKTWMELGSGIGNFTLPLAVRCESVIAVELEAQAVECLKRNINIAGLTSKVQVQQKDYRRMTGASSMNFEAVLCDPPRSGLGAFVEWLGDQPNVRSIVYVSCFAESFVNDAVRLASLGFKLDSLVGVDQFPQTEHCELVARFEKVVNSSPVV